MRLGVVTWSLLGHPSVDAKNGTMRVKELFKARRVVPQCQCGCQIVEEAISEQYLGTIITSWIGRRLRSCCSEILTETILVSI
jgi:hypothetical protein